MQLIFDFIDVKKTWATQVTLKYIYMYKCMYTYSPYSPFQGTLPLDTSRSVEVVRIVALLKSQVESTKAVTLVA